MPIKLASKPWILVNIYAPNKDDLDIFQKFIDYTLNFVCENIIFDGDFNAVLDIKMDKKRGNRTTHGKSIQKINEISDNLDLTDIWRDLHPEERRFTWRQKNPAMQRRLDFFLISQGLSSNITEADIFPGYRTDHSLIVISVSLNENPRGPGYWKLNISFLTEIEYILI